MSMVIISVLMAAMMSAILISRHGLDDGTSTAAKTIVGRQAIDEMTADLRLALSVTEATTTAVTFTVPDRTGDDVAETIRYTWSGTAGDPVIRTFNGTTVDFVDDVHDLDFTYFTRTIKAETDYRLLFVVGDAASPTAEDLARQAQFELWGYEVTLIDDDSTEAQFNATFDEHLVIYVSESVDFDVAATHIANATIGVVSEERGMAYGMGAANTTNQKGNSTQIKVTDNTHYITSDYSINQVLTVTDTTTDFNTYSGTIASGGQTLADTMLNPKKIALITIDTGGTLWDGSSTAAGRRVMLPWFAASGGWGDLTVNGRTITQRAIEWAAGLDGTSGKLQFGLKAEGGSSQSSSTSRIRCTQATLNQDATITDLVAYIQGPIGEQVRFGIYTDSGGEPGTKIVETSLDSLTTSTAHWHTINITPTDLTAGTYWLAIGFSDQSMYYYYSSGGKTRHKYSDTPTLPSNWGESGYYPNWTFSIYGVGTPLNE